MDKHRKIANVIHCHSQLPGKRNCYDLRFSIARIVTVSQMPQVSRIVLAIVTMERIVELVKTCQWMSELAGIQKYSQT